MTYTSDAVDRLGVQDLYSRYCFAMDSSDAAGMADCFTADGVFDIVGRKRFEGREAIKHLVANTTAQRPRHVWVNLMIRRCAAGVADSTSYFLVINPSTGAITGYGEYRDESIKGPDGMWRFQNRVVDFKWQSEENAARTAHVAAEN